MPDLLSRINNPQLVTIYQPTSQLTFAAVMAMRIEAWDPLGDRTWRMAMVGFDMLIVALLLWRLRRGMLSAAWAMLYAWHPLPIWKIAGAGHQDVIGIAWMLVGLLCCEAVARRRSSGGAIVGGIAVAMAVAVKPYALLVVLPAVWVLRRFKPIASGVVAGSVALIALYASFVLTETGLSRMFETGRVFSAWGDFNGSLHPLLLGLIGSRGLTDVVTVAFLFVAVVCIAWRFRCRVTIGTPQAPHVHAGLHGALWLSATAALLAGLLFAAIVHPWYILWPLALLPLACALNPQSRGASSVAFAVWWLAATIPLTYVVHLTDGPYRVPTWVLLIEYVPVFAALLRGMIGGIKTHGPSVAARE